MQSHNLTSTAEAFKLLQNKHPASETMVAYVTPPEKFFPAEQSAEADQNQQTLNSIAEQPTNLGHGCGVILNKVATSIKTFCSQQLKKQLARTNAGFGDYFRSSWSVFTMLKDFDKRSSDNNLINQCYQLAQEVEDNINRNPRP